jgi:hypothetical protein
MPSNEAPVFFLPEVEPSKYEEIYRDLARRCGQMPEVGERIYSIKFSGNGDTWTATVGQRLTGTTTMKPRGKPARQQGISDTATVLAIFPGPPCYVVWTNKGMGNVDNTTGQVRSRFENPFLAGEPSHIEYFAT